ncbi:MAG: DUF983 domain-containing protein [Alphaproteobacteria bacterium]
MNHHDQVGSNEARPKPFITGWRGLCPRCAKGALYQSYLKPAASCKICTLDYSRADAGDGAVPFVMMAAGTVGVLIGVGLMFHFGLSMLITILVSCSAAMAVTLYLLPRVKGVLIAMQYYYKAGDETALRFRDSD